MTKVMHWSQASTIPALEHYSQMISTKQSNQKTLISQQLLILKQNQLIEQIMKLPKKVYKSAAQCEDPEDYSISTIENSKMLSASKSSIEFFSSSFKLNNNFFLKQALKQVRKNCSATTYRLVREKVKSTDISHLQSHLQKQIKHNQQLMKNCLKLSHEVAELKSKLELATEKMKNLEKLKLAKQKTVNLQKNQLFLKWQKSMLHKQKLQAEVKKCLNRKFQVLQEQNKINEALRNELLELSNNETEIGEISQLLESIEHNICEQKNLNEMHRKQHFNHQRQLQSIFQELRSCLNANK